MYELLLVFLILYVSGSVPFFACDTNGFAIDKSRWVLWSSGSLFSDCVSHPIKVSCSPCLNCLECCSGYMVHAWLFRCIESCFSIWSSFIDWFNTCLVRCVLGRPCCCCALLVGSADRPRFLRWGWVAISTDEAGSCPSDCVLTRSLDFSHLKRIRSDWVTTNCVGSASKLFNELELV